MNFRGTGHCPKIMYEKSTKGLNFFMIFARKTSEFLERGARAQLPHLLPPSPPFPTLMTKTGERLRTDIQIFGDSSFCRYKFYPVIHWGSWRGISSNKKCFHSSRIRCSLRSVKLAIYKEHLDHFCCLSHNNNNNNTLIYIAPACRMTSCHKTQTHV